MFHVVALARTPVTILSWLFTRVVKRAVPPSVNLEAVQQKRCAMPHLKRSASNIWPDLAPHALAMIAPVLLFKTQAKFLATCTAGND
jgi:hypothetical protein